MTLDGRSARRASALRRMAAAGALCIALAGPVLAQQESLEYPIKATFLVRFGAYVEWPAAAFASGDDPLQICVAGRDPFGEVLDELAAKESVGAHALAVRRLAPADDPSQCHVVYIGQLAPETDASVLERADGRPVLVVTDAAQNGGVRGAIHFVVVDDRVRFHIDEDAAAHNQLGLSSQLLSVALSVRRKGEP